MTVRSARLAAATSNPSGSTVTVYTCPVGVTTILKDARLCTSAGTPGRVVLSVLSGGVAVSLMDRAFNAVEVQALSTWVVLEPGDTVRVNAAAGEVKLWLSGAELSGVAP